MREDVVRMMKQELERRQVIQRVLRGELTQVLAGEALRLSEHQVRRMVKKVRRRGARALAHASRGLESPRKMAEALEDRIVEIIRFSHSVSPRSWNSSMGLIGRGYRNQRTVGNM